MRTTKSKFAIESITLTFLIAGSFFVLAVGIDKPLAISSCNNPSTLEQCGTGSCIPIQSPVNNCAITITFSPAFASTPKFASAQVQGCHSPECHHETSPFPMSNVVFQADNGETWTSMPAAKTEIYGNNRHEVAVLTQAAMVSAEFSVGCITGSSSATAILRPEFSTDSGTTWTALANPLSGNLDILVDSGDCSFSASPAFAVGPIGMNSAAIGVSVIFRVVGLNGGGVGDNPVFNNIQLTFFANFGDMYLTCIQGISPYICINGCTITRTTMCIAITRMAPALSGLGTLILVNWMASE